MNKKFSTLMASLLLAGSAFSVANATDFATLAGNGKYYKIQRSAYYTKSVFHNCSLMFSVRGAILTHFILFCKFFRQ